MWGLCLLCPQVERTFVKFGWILVFIPEGPTDIFRVSFRRCLLLLRLGWLAGYRSAGTQMSEELLAGPPCYLPSDVVLPFNCVHFASSAHSQSLQSADVDVLGSTLPHRVRRGTL